MTWFVSWTRSIPPCSLSLTLCKVVITVTKYVVEIKADTNVAPAGSRVDRLPHVVVHHIGGRAVLQ